MPSSTVKKQYSAPAWGISPYQDLDLPSGAHVQVKQLDFVDIAKAGLIDEFDALSPEAEKEIVGPARGKPSDRQKKKPTKAQKAKADRDANMAFFKDTDSVGKMTSVMSRLLPICVVQPAIVSDLDEDGEKIPEGDREEGLIYVDSIPLGDRMTIFGWFVGDLDLDGLKQFRAESESGVGNVADEQEGGVSA